MAGQVTAADVADGPVWDEAVGRLAGANIFASRPWGAYKARVGWHVRRVAFRCPDEQALAYAQYQERRIGPVRFVLAQGCPVLTPLGKRRAGAVIGTFLAHLDLGRFDLLGVSYHHFQTVEAVLALLRHGFVPILAARDHTLELDLTQDAQTIRAAMEKTWRTTLTRAEQNPDLDAAFLTDTDERLRAFDGFSRMYADLKQRKGFTTRLDTAAYRDVAAADPNLVFLEIRERGVPILVRIVHRAQERWTDFFVASTERAQAIGAARLSVWRMIERAQAEGCVIFDLGGIDPAGNPGVFNFKRGLGQTAVVSNPLWLFGRTGLVRNAAATILARR